MNHDQSGESPQVSTVCMAQKRRNPRTPQTADDSRLIDIPTAGSWLSCSRSSIYGLMDSGAIVSVKCGRSRRIVAQSVRDYVAKLIAAAEQAS